MKKLLFFAAILAVFVTVISCNKENDPSISVTGVIVSPESLEMEIGNQKTLTATITPKDATNKGVKFVSSKENVATVTQDGIVEALSAGSAIVTVTTEDGNYMAHCTVTVLEKVIHVTGIALNKTSLSLTEGDEFTLIPTITPENATDKSVNWTSSNEAVAAVSSKGVVKALKAGTATVTATTVDQQKTATCEVEVSEGAVTGDATHISCRNAKIAGKANISGKTAIDLSFGVLYSTSSVILIGAATKIEAKTLDSEYNFSINTEVLEPKTTYYYRSYIIQNTEIFYGEVKSFKTLEVSSMIKTKDATDINYKEVTLNAFLDLTDCKYETLGYGFEITPKGGSSHTVKASNHSGQAFSVKDETLVSNTNYSCVAYVTLDGRTYKGDVKNFTTTPEIVDLGLSVKWRSWNVGASKPEECGTYFAWGDVTGQIWNGEWSGGGFSTYPTYGLDANGNLRPAYDAAHVNLGGSWRMPTKAEIDELEDNCTDTWTSDYNGTGVAGCIFTSNKEGYTDKSIFLPAAGYGAAGSMSFKGGSGFYWSSTFNYGNYARYLFFGSGVLGGRRDHGQSVRPVTE